MMRKIVLVVVALMCCSFLGCDAASPSSGEVTTFTVLFTDANARVDWGHDEVSKRILEKTNVNLEIEVLQDDILTRVDTMIAQNKYPDMIFSLSNEAVSKLLKVDALEPLDNYLERGGDNIKEVFGDDIEKMRSNIDNKIYGFNREYKAISSLPAANFFVQYDVLKEAGYPDISDITLSELKKILADYAKKYPYINGVKTIGLSAYGDDFGMNITFNNPAMSAAGYQNDGNYAVDKNGKVTYGLRLDSSKEFFKWLNGMSVDGLFDSEAVVQKRAKFVEKVTNGHVLAVMTEPWDIDDSETVLRRKGLNNRCYAPIPVRLNEDTDISNISNYSRLGSWKSVVTKQNHNKQKAFDFINEMWSEEMQILANWGVEGTHYDIIDGKRVLRQSIIDECNTNPNWKSDLALTIYGMFSCGANVKDSSGQYIVPFSSNDYLYQNYDDYVKDFLSRYKKQSFKEFFPPPLQTLAKFAWKLDLPMTSVGAMSEAEINNKLRREYIPRVILSDTEKFEQIWLEFQNSMSETQIVERENEIATLLKKSREA